MPADDLSRSPFFQADGPDAAAVQATLLELAAAVPSVDAAADALEAGALEPSQRDALLADMLRVCRRLLALALGRVE